MATLVAPPRPATRLNHETRVVEEPTTQTVVVTPAVEAPDSLAEDGYAADVRVGRIAVQLLALLFIFMVLIVPLSLALVNLYQLW